jgi:O-methyltransferase involved in polyketide biosynthesis
MNGKVKVELGDVQQTLFIPLAARARQTGLKRPVLRDPKAVEIANSVDFDARTYARGWGGVVTVLRTVIFDGWVRAFLAEHPAGTVVELGTGLNTRFDRVDNGQVHWIDLDLPDTIELRKKFFVDTDRRLMVVGSLLDEDWFAAVRESPGPYFFACEGVLTYLDQAPEVISRIAAAFPDAMPALTRIDPAIDLQRDGAFGASAPMSGRRRHGSDEIRIPAHDGNHQCCGCRGRDRRRALGVKADWPAAAPLPR